MNTKTVIMVLNVPWERLAMAPPYRSSKITDPGYDERVDRFFGLAPRWEENSATEKDPYRWGGEAQGF